MKCLICARFPFCKKTTKASDGCNEGIKRKLEDEVEKHEYEKVITVKESSQKIAPITESVELVGTIIPAYVTFDKEHLTGTYVRYPERKELPADIHEELVVEFYNKMS